MLSCVSAWLAKPFLSLQAKHTGRAEHPRKEHSSALEGDRHIPKSPLHGTRSSTGHWSGGRGGVEEGLVAMEHAVDHTNHSLNLQKQILGVENVY